MQRTRAGSVRSEAVRLRARLELVRSNLTPPRVRTRVSGAAWASSLIRGLPLPAAPRRSQPCKPAGLGRQRNARWNHNPPRWCILPGKRAASP